MVIHYKNGEIHMNLVLKADPRYYFNEYSKCTYPRKSTDTVNIKTKKKTNNMAYNSFP